MSERLKNTENASATERPDTRTAEELEHAKHLNASPDALKFAAVKYNLDPSEQLILLLAVAPFYMGSPYGGLSFKSPLVDVDRYAREIVADRDIKKPQKIN